MLREELLLVWRFALAVIAGAGDRGGRRVALACLLVAAGVAAWGWRLRGLDLLADLAAMLR